MIACVDVDYRPQLAVAACVEIRNWSDATPASETTIRLAGPIADYVPGEFYRRELPALLAVLRQIQSPSIVVVDGYVTLGERPGLGLHLYEALDRRVAVVGVAKTTYRGAGGAVPVLRGGSRRPLFISAVGIDVGAAAEGVLAMAGDARIPTILKRVDRLSRTIVSP
jgi:deoxyribonuclease V